MRVALNSKRLVLRVLILNQLFFLFKGLAGGKFFLKGFALWQIPAKPFFFISYFSLLTSLLTIPLIQQIHYFCIMHMQKFYLLIFVFSILFILAATDLQAQCSICSRTAQQLGEKPARGLNAGILYLAVTPLILIAFIGFRWWRRNKNA